MKRKLKPWVVFVIMIFLISLLSFLCYEMIIILDKQSKYIQGVNICIEKHNRFMSFYKMNYENNTIECLTIYKYDYHYVYDINNEDLISKHCYKGWEYSCEIHE